MRINDRTLVEAHRSITNLDATEPNDIVVSVVVPVYACRSSLGELCARVANALAAIGKIEIILVDDASPDDAWQTIEKLSKASSLVRGVRLSRNFGQHAAIAAGISVSQGAWTAVLDCDLEDPPEVLFDVYQKARTGYDIVIGRRTNRPHGIVRAMLSRLYFSLVNLLSEVKIDGALGALSIFSRKVRVDYLKMDDGDRHHSMILRWLGYRTAVVDYKQEDRGIGSSYTFGALLRSGVSGIVFHTTALLHLVIYSGLVMAFLGFVAAIALVHRYYSANLLPGWTSLAVLQLIIGGVIIVCIGIVGLYVGRMFEKARHRPLFIIEKIVESSSSSR